MSLTIIVNTQFGPIPSGSVLVLPLDHAKELIEKYGSNLSISAQHPGIYWYQDGNTLTINAPKVGASQQNVLVQVIFDTDVSDPILGEFYAGEKYLLTLNELTDFASRRQDLVINPTSAYAVPFPEYFKYTDTSFKVSLPQ